MIYGTIFLSCTTRWNKISSVLFWQSVKLWWDRKKLWLLFSCSFYGLEQFHYSYIGGEKFECSSRMRQNLKKHDIGRAVDHWQHSRLLLLKECHWVTCQFNVALHHGISRFSINLEEVKNCKFFIQIQSIYLNFLFLLRSETSIFTTSVKFCICWATSFQPSATTA